MPKAITIDLNDFRIDVRDGAATTRVITDFSVGSPTHPTDRVATGLDAVRKLMHISTKYPEPDGGAKMPYTLFFNDGSGCAFHAGTTSVASHGCIHLDNEDAQWLYGWAGAAPVALAFPAGPYPANPISAKVYRQGAQNMSRVRIGQIKAALAAHAFLSASPVGVFDGALDAAVRAFQTAQGLEVDGKVGHITAGALGVTL